MARTTAEAVVLTHLSRRTHLASVLEALELAIPARHRDRLYVLMDGRTNRKRYAQQFAESLEQENCRQANGR